MQEWRVHVFFPSDPSEFEPSKATHAGTTFAPLKKRFIHLMDKWVGRPLTTIASSFSLPESFYTRCSSLRKKAWTFSVREFRG